MESTGFSPPQQESPEGLTSSGSFDTPEAPAKTMRSNEGAVTTSVPVACAVPRPPDVTIHRNNRTRTRDERSQAAVSVSSARSGETRDVQAELLRAREIARKRRERLEAEEEELELDRQLAACSSPKRSSAGSVRSSPSSVRTSPVQQNVYLTQRSLLQHELETEVNLCSDADWDDNAQSSAQAERTALAQVLLVPKAAAVARIAAASPPAAPVAVQQLPDFPLNLS